MDIWQRIGNIAKQFLGDNAPSSIDLSKIENNLLPRQPLAPSFLKIPAKQELPLPPSKPDADSLEVIPQYNFILEAIKAKCPAIFVTGKAGTGKSTLVRFLTGKIKNSIVVAPTSIAAINVNGSTIHSLFHFPPKTLNPDELYEPRPWAIPILKSMEVLIIDEISMVPPEIIDCIDNSLRYSRKDNCVFGGVPIVFVGDLLQLPPVEEDEAVVAFHTDRYRSPYFFSADAFKKARIIPIELTRVFRQSEQGFIELLDRIRLNQDHSCAVKKFNRECCRGSVLDLEEKSLLLVTTRANAATINSHKLSSLDAESHIFEAVVTGDFNIQHNKFQAPHLLEIKKGAQVIFVKNKRPSWLNGTLGEVATIGKDRIGVKVCPHGNIVDVEREVWEKTNYKYDPIEKKIIRTVAGTYKQFPLNLGWAITIHKSQGMTLDSVRIDLGRGAFCAGQVYVALSRCRTMQGIRLERPISMKDVRANTMLLEFYKEMKNISSN